jgi:hypothetical protein
LQLLQICLVSINTLMIQWILSDPTHTEAMQTEDSRSMTPLIYRHITPYGWFHVVQS